MTLSKPGTTASKLLHRIGWSVEVPAQRAADRDEAAVSAWPPTASAQVTHVFGTHKFPSLIIRDDFRITS